MESGTDLWVKLAWCQARWRLADAGGSSLGGLLKFNSCSPFNEYQQCGLCHPNTVQALESPRKKTCFLLLGISVLGEAC